MKISEKVLEKIKRFEKGHVFTSENFKELNKEQATIKALNRLVEKGDIARLSSGMYFKPETTPFGTLAPKQEQVVKDLLVENNKVVGYLTGFSIYNQLGLTTQVSNTIQIGKNDVRPIFKRERYTIHCIKQKNTITQKNIPLLQLLDSLRFIKKIPDTTIEQSCNRFVVLLKELAQSEIVTMIRLSLKYPPSTRALLGVILEEIGYLEESKQLKDTLNPLTTYNISTVKAVFPQAQNWNFV